MKKRIFIILLLSAVCAFGVMFSAACASGGANEIPKEEVTAPVNNEDELKKLQQQIAALQEEIKKLSDKTEDMQEEIENLTDRIKELEQENLNGSFYSLQEAYKNGLLTNEDLELFAHYYNENIKFPEEIDGKIEAKIKADMANELRRKEANPVKDAKPEDVFVVEFYGVYSGSYIVILGNNYVSYPAEPINETCEIGGVVINIWHYEPILVWMANS